MVVVATTRCCAVRGITGLPVTVEADVVPGLPSVTVVGLTDRAIQESRERVRAAVTNSGYAFPKQRLTVNLAPAEVPKEGTGFDLAIAVAVVSCGGHAVPAEDTGLIGELALDGLLRPVLGVLPMVRALRAAGTRRVVVPEGNAAEAALVEGVEVLPARSLDDCVRHLDGRRRLVRAAPPPLDGGPPAPQGELAEVRGQLTAKRALEVAAAGGHNLLMVGPPGSGKTMLARAFASLLPDLDAEQSLEVATVYSLRGAWRERPPTCTRPPFRSPHHSISRAGLVGGGSGLAQPGEISLAHCGVLFLDELCEFPRSLLEALRQPLEERRVTLARSRGAVTLPADFALVAAANPCPCGHRGDRQRPCSCDERALTAYRGRLSGPVRDRIDMVVDVPRQPFAALFGEGAEGPTSTQVRSRVAAARLGQARRGAVNASLAGRALGAACRPTAGAARLLAQAGERQALSGRAYHRVLRVGRSIADLAGVDRVDEGCLLEALRLRGEVGV